MTIENLEIPAGAACVLEGTRVEGNVYVRGGASLEAHGARVDGNIQAEDAAVILATSATLVGGNVQVKRRALVIVADNLQMVKNRGGATLIDKWIAQSLQCDENEPAPTRSGNEAGEREGQCAPL